MSEAAELRQRATDMRSLATDVRGLLDTAKNYVNHDMDTWAGPNKEEVSGALSTWHTECGSVATDLEGIADSLDAQADDAEEQGNGEGEGD